jgi:hypothetical protein
MGSRDFLKAYLRSEDAHKQIHKLVHAFEQDASNAEIERHLNEVYRLLTQVKSHLEQSK